MAAPTIQCYINNDYRAGALTIVGKDILGEIVDIYRYDQRASEKLLIRGGYGYEVSDTGFVMAVDPEVPLNDTVIYEIVMMPNGRDDPLRQTIRTSGCRVTDTSVYYEEATCEPIYLSDPLIPSYGQWFGLLSIDPLQYPARGALFDVIGRGAPVAVSQLRSTARTTIKLLTTTREQRADMLLMLYAGRILLYRNPDLDYPERHWYLAIGEVAEERIVPDHRDIRRRWVLEVAVVDRPVGYLSLVRSSRDYTVYKTFEPDGFTPIAPATYAGAYADYGDYVDVLLGAKSAAYVAPAAAGGLPISSLKAYAYGDGRYPTIEAARTSWSLM